MTPRTTHHPILRVLALATMLSTLFIVAAPGAGADHGEGHNGETMELSQQDGLQDGDEVAVTLTSFLPDAAITVVTCFNYPAVGPADCELSNYGEHTATADADGGAELDYPITVIPDRCDHANDCYIVAGDGFGASANYAAQPVTFAEPGGGEETTTTAAETTTTAAETTTTAAETTTTAAPEDSTTTTTTTAPDGDEDDDSNTAVTIAIIVAIVALLGGGGYLVMRNRGS